MNVKRPTISEPWVIGLMAFGALCLLMGLLNVLSELVS